MAPRMRGEGRSSSSPGPPVLNLGSSGHSGSAPSSLTYRASQHAESWGARPGPGGVQGLLAAGDMRPPPFPRTSWTTPLASRPAPPRPRSLPNSARRRSSRSSSLAPSPFGVARAEAPCRRRKGTGQLDARLGVARGENRSSSPAPRPLRPSDPALRARALPSRGLGAGRRLLLLNRWRAGRCCCCRRRTQRLWGWPALGRLVPTPGAPGA